MRLVGRQLKVLDEYRPSGEPPFPGRSEADPRVTRQCDPTPLRGAVGPQRCVHVVRDEAYTCRQVVDGAKYSRLGQKARKKLRVAGDVQRDDPFAALQSIRFVTLN